MPTSCTATSPHNHEPQPDQTNTRSMIKCLRFWIWAIDGAFVVSRSMSALRCRTRAAAHGPLAYPPSGPRIRLGLLTGAGLPLLFVAYVQHDGLAEPLRFEVLAAQDVRENGSAATARVVATPSDPSRLHGACRPSPGDPGSRRECSRDFDPTRSWPPATPSTSPPRA